MSLTPVEVRHLALRRGLFGYRRSDVHRVIEEIADSFEAVWRERAELNERVDVLETEVARHVELETLLRSTLVSAERAAQDMKEQARREAEVIVAEANAEGRRLVRDAIAEKERLLAESRRVESILRAALEVISEGRSGDAGARGGDASPARSRPRRTRGRTGSRGNRARADYPSGVPVGERIRATTRLRLRVVPGARRSQVVGRHGEAWKLRVHAAPERGRANDEVVALLAETLGLPQSEIRVVAGRTTRDKVVELSRLTLDEAEQRLTAAAESAG